jgi:hypothetical protein
VPFSDPYSRSSERIESFGWRGAKGGILVAKREMMRMRKMWMMRTDPRKDLFVFLNVQKQSEVEAKGKVMSTTQTSLAGW